MPSAQNWLCSSCAIWIKNDHNECQQLEVGSLLVPVPLPPAASALFSLRR